jgi:D-amino-acid dehydrogenase
MNGVDSTLSCAVVGGGVIGLCTALQLRRRGLDVTLIDANLPGTGASFGNAGFLAVESIDPLSTWTTLKAAPAMLLDKNGPLKVPAGNRLAALSWLARFGMAARPAVVEKNRSALASLNSHAVKSWQTCLDSIGQAHLLVQSGYLLAWENSAGLVSARQERDHLRRWGITVDLIDSQAIDALEPALCGRFSHALYFADAWRVRDPKWLCDALFQAFIKQGGIFVQRRVERIDLSRPQPRLCLAGEFRSFSRLVLCAGAHSAQLLAPLGIQIPLMAERGYHLHCHGVSEILGRPICPVERKVFLSPLDSGLRVVGISELGGTQLPEQPSSFATLKHHAKALFPSLVDQLDNAEHWMGMRPTLPDSLPVIDTLAQHCNTVVAFGNQHLGLTQAAISAQLAVNRLLGERPIIELLPFSIERFK